MSWSQLINKNVNSIQYVAPPSNLPNPFLNPSLTAMIHNPFIELSQNPSHMPSPAPNSYPYNPLKMNISAPSFDPKSSLTETKTFFQTIDANISHILEKEA